MSVATRNPFAILEEDDSPPSPPPAAPSAPPSQQTPAAAPAKRAKGGPAVRGGRYYQRGGSRQNTADRDAPASDDPPASSDTKQRHSDGERRDGRGRGRGSNRGRGRTYDRHSATGKIDSDKKLHNGWGGDDGNTEFKVEEAATFDAAAESGNLNDWAAPVDTSAGDWGAPTQESAPEPAPDAEKPDSARRRDQGEEEDNTVTFAQYVAQQKEKESDLLPKLETRKANDGAEDAIWDGATLLQKGEGETYFSGKSKSAPKARAEKKEKVFLEIDAHFERPSRGRGRGDRGEGRGRGGRGRGGRGRGGANGTATTAVSMDDETAFPSLS
ncbi:hypothetical protein JVU11DRAFT_5193 [Chiua virens]|nr:hypothetical protein JVU11DRAFT_5193 [Chiua virens]